MFAARSAATKGPRGSKNSPFVGRYETLDDSNPILYSRVILPSAAKSGSKRESDEDKKDRNSTDGSKLDESATEANQEHDNSENMKAEKKAKKEKRKEKEKEKEKKRKGSASEASAMEEDAVAEPGKPSSFQAEEATADADEGPSKEERKRKKKERQEDCQPIKQAEDNTQSSDAVQSADGKKRKKPRSEKGLLRQKMRAEARAERIAAGEDVEQKQDSKDSAPERLIKGAKTLQEEAQVMRERMGLVSAETAVGEEAAEPAAVEVKKDNSATNPSSEKGTAQANPTGGFSFGFTVNAKVEQEMEDRVARLTGMVRNEEGQVVAAAQPDTDGRRVYVGGMPFSYDEASIKEYWEYCGELEDIDMMTFPDTGNFRGIVFLTFKTPEAAKSALEYDGEDCDGKTLKVKPAHSRGKKSSVGNKPSRPQGPAQKTPGYNVLYVGNLSYEATEQDIRDHFRGCNVTKVRIHTDKDTGRPKGYAHVHVEDDESMDMAAELDQSELQGRPIKVMFAQPKKN